MIKKAMTEITPKFERLTSSKLRFGAHVGISGGVSNSVTNAYNLGCNSFAMFLKNPRKWAAPPLTDEEVDKFHQLCKQYKYDARTDILVHGQYFINLCNPSQEASEKSYATFRDDLQRCEKLGIGNYNLHPGSVLKGGDRAKGIAQLADYINKVHAETNFVKVVLENMASDNVIGCQLQDLKDVIDKVKDQDRVGVCIDTCHAFAAGYDLRSEEAFAKFWKEFDETIGFQYLAGLHLNDSKGPLLSNRDLHQNLGLGFLGLEAFRLIASADLSNTIFKSIPIILETPYTKNVGEDHYGEEIKLLEWLVDKNGDAKEYIEKREQLSKNGAKERGEQLQKFEKKQMKRSADAEKAANGGKKRKKTRGKDIGAFFKKGEE